MKVHPTTPPVTITVEFTPREIAILRRIGGIGGTASHLLQKECGWTDGERIWAADFFRDLFYNLPNFEGKDRAKPV